MSGFVLLRSLQLHLRIWRPNLQVVADGLSSPSWALPRLTAEIAVFQSHCVCLPGGARFSWRCLWCRSCGEFHGRHSLCLCCSTRKGSTPTVEAPPTGRAVALAGRACEVTSCTVEAPLTRWMVKAITSDGACIVPGGAMQKNLLSKVRGQCLTGLMFKAIPSFIVAAH